MLARYDPFTHSVCRVNKTRNYGIEPRNAEQSFAFEVLNDPDVKLVVALTGKAGTGKRCWPWLYAGKLTDYKQILLARPLLHCPIRILAIFHGDANEKVAPLYIITPV